MSFNEAIRIQQDFMRMNQSENIAKGSGSSNKNNQDFPQEVLDKLDQLLGKGKTNTKEFPPELLAKLDNILGKDSKEQISSVEMQMQMDWMFGNRKNFRRGYDYQTGRMYTEVYEPSQGRFTPFTPLLCDPPGGTRKPPLNPLSGLIAAMNIFLPLDPNLIIGPEGQPDKKWVSVKDRMPYTILFENDSTATARTRYIKITTPIEPKQDAATLELGSFGFNNQSFEIPAGTSSYYQRLDTRDSTGLYVDITAGYDVINNQVFWEFQGIDPVTLLPPEDPLAGFLFLQDSTQPDYGNGFVNFSIKPLASSQTLDTIGARAFIVFDENEVIPTNIHSNTIDAVAPISSLDSLPAITPDTEITLTYNGTDDPNGSGVKWYSIYVADDNGPPELYVSNFTGTDTTFRGVAEHTYKFYVTATDTAGNIELLKLVDSVKISSGEYSICPNGNVSFDSKMTGTSFQWQVDNGTGFTDVMDGGIYSGATTAVLNLTTAPTTMYGYQYRCLVNGSTYSDVFLLKFGMTWEGTLSTAWEDPANWSCNSLPDMNTDVIINGGKTNYPVITSNPTVRTLRLNPGATGTVNTGYQLTIMK